jgi:tryptophan halogenase
MYGDEIPVEDFALSYFPAAALYETNKFSENLYGLFDNFNPKTDVAFHFDATKFGQWLKNNYSIPRGVKHVSATVVDVVVNEQGVDYLVLDNGEKVTSDLFVDATGWKSLLLGGALNVPFESYSDLLPNNKAWATRIPYINKEQELEPFTNCTALGNGWVWNIPLWSRIGTGYVFSDKFVTEQDALEEFHSINFSLMECW